MKAADAKNVQEEKELIGKIWGLLRTAIHENLNKRFKFSSIKKLSDDLDIVVNEYQSPLLKGFAESIALSCIRYVCNEQMGSGHDEEAKVFNKTYEILRKGYWYKSDGEEADEDWEEIINMANAYTQSFAPQVYQLEEDEEPVYLSNNIICLASSMMAAVLSYLSDLSEDRINRSLDKAENAIKAS